MVHLDLFAGIHGFYEGLIRAGMPITAHHYSEVDKHAIAVSRHNHPHAKELGSVTTVSGKHLPRPNIVTLGSPCQNFSVSGNGTGLGGSKSSLIKEAIRLLAETRPDVFIWENVAGAFSTNGGADFWAIINAFTNLRGYRLEWQLVNTAWLLPQNRERIYLIGHLDGASRPGVFPFTDSDFSHPFAKSQTVNCIDANYWKGIDNQAQRTVVHDTMSMLTWQNKKQGVIEKDIVPTLRSSPGTDIRKSPVVRQLNMATDSGGMQPYQQDRVYDPEGIAPAIVAGMEGRGHIIGLKEITRNVSQSDRVYDVDGIAPTSQRGSDNSGTVVPSIKLRELTSGESDAFRIYDAEGLARTLKAEAGGGGAKMGNYKTQEGYRRLTEVECERLQGFREIRKTLYIKVWKKCNYIAPQRLCANAESRCLRLRKLALSVARIALKSHAKYAENPLKQKFRPTKKPALPLVHIHCEEGKVEVRNQGKLLLFANTADGTKELAPLVEISSFVLQLVRINAILEATTPDGKAEFRRNEHYSVRQRNGSPVLNWFGDETMRPVGDAKKDMTILAKRMKFITSSLSKTKTTEQVLPTLYSYVMDAIDGCIPEEIKQENFLIEIDIQHGKTAFGNYNGIIKNVPKTERYRMCGNAVTVDMVELIGKRLKTCMGI